MSKRIHITCIAILFLSLLGSCEKEFDSPQDALPSVETVSAEMAPSGKIRLKGNVTREGFGDLKHIGFFMGPAPQLNMLDHQLLLDPEKGEYSTDIDPIEPNDTLYFNTFAANKYGYTIGSVKSFIMPYPEPAVAPCTPADNSLLYAGSTFTNAIIYAGKQIASWGEYAVRGSWVGTGGPEVTVEFNREKPINGVYTTGNIIDFPNDPTLVMVRILDFETNYCLDGGKVYVSENGDGSYYVTFCNLKYVLFDNGYSLKGRMLVK